MVKPLQFLILVFLSLLGISSCSAAGSKAGTPVTDEELDAAIEEAHSTLDTLLAAMLAPRASHDFLGLKVRFATKDGGYDDNWVEPLDYYDGKFTIRMKDGDVVSFESHLKESPSLMLFSRIGAENSIYDKGLCLATGNLGKNKEKSSPGLDVPRTSVLNRQIRHTQEDTS